MSNYVTEYLDRGIGRRIGAAFVALFVFVAFAASVIWRGQVELSVLKDEMDARSDEALVTQRLSSLGAEGYRKVADIQINAVDDERRVDWTKFVELSHSQFDTLVKLADVPQETAWIADSRKALDSIDALVGMMIVLETQDSITPRPTRHLDDLADDQVSIIASNLDGMRACLQAEMERASADYDASLKRNRQILLAMLAFLLLSSIASWWWLQNGVVPSLRELAGQASLVSQGNTGVHVKANSKDEIGRLATAFRELIHLLRDRAGQAESIGRGELSKTVVAKSNADTLGIGLESMRRSLVQTATGIQAGSSQVAMVSRELEGITNDLERVGMDVATRTEALTVDAAAVESQSQTLASIAEEMSASIQEISRSAAETSVRATATARELERTDEIVKGLESSGAEIGKVVGLIRDISDQTRLLALNATIEAARAGEAGKGFAVVAGEVKDLAARTTQATEQIETNVENIRKDMSEAGKALRETRAKVGEIVSASQSIAAAVEEQQAATSETVRGVAEGASRARAIAAAASALSSAAADSSRSAEEVHAAVERLSKTVGQLETLAGSFKL